VFPLVANGMMASPLATGPPRRRKPESRRALLVNFQVVGRIVALKVGLARWSCRTTRSSDHLTRTTRAQSPPLQGG
jgi:hypothetical protein